MKSGAKRVNEMILQDTNDVSTLIPQAHLLFIHRVFSLNPLTWSETGLSLRSRGMADYQDWKEGDTESDENPTAIAVWCWRETGTGRIVERTKQRGQISPSLELFKP